MTYAVAAPLAVVALALAYAARRRPAEAATILIVAIPVVLLVPQYTPRWLSSLRAHYRMDAAGALAVAPPLITRERNLRLARHALSAIPPDGTYAVVSYRRYETRRAAARRTYYTSWLQYWLAPRVQVDPADAQWLILLHADGTPVPAGARAVYRFGDDLLVQR